MDERAPEGDEAYGQREHDHLVEPMFEALRPGGAPQGSGRPRRARSRRWTTILTVVALAAAVWAALRA